MDRRSRLATAVAIFFSALFVMLVWPVYPRFATIDPRILGMPFSLVYVVCGLLISFFALLGYYLWERQSERLQQAKESGRQVGEQAEGDGI